MGEILYSKKVEAVLGFVGVFSYRRCFGGWVRVGLEYFVVVFFLREKFILVEKYLKEVVRCELKLFFC